VLAVAALVLTGCGAGQRAQTATEVPVIDGVTATIGTINLRALTIVTPPTGSYASGAAASVQVYIVNTGSPDQLISVSSSSAKSVGLYGNLTQAIQAAVLATIPASSAAAAPSASASSSASAAPTSAAIATPAFTIPLASGETTSIGTAATAPQIQLLGLSTTLYPAMSIPLTFTFANAGAITVAVSVHLSTGGVTAPTLATTHATAAE
jgi:copper(I)-binding protein